VGNKGATIKYLRCELFTIIANTIKVDRAAEDGFGNARAVGGEVVGALLVGLAAAVGAAKGNGGAVKKACADRDVGGFGRRFALGEQIQVFNSQVTQRQPAT